MDEKILNYKGIVIRRCDRRILQKENYLNDRVIEFYFSYLTTVFKTEDILLLSPSVSSSLAKPSDTKSLNKSTEELKLDQRKLILFPVKDNDSASDDEEGSHWSLLVYYRPIHLFVHHDSLGGINNSRARKLYENVKNVVGYGGKGETVRTLSGKNKRYRSEACFTEFFTPQEAYGYDSGSYVLVSADTICEWVTSWSVRRNGCWFDALEKRFHNPYVKLNIRSDVLEIIDTLTD